MIICMINSQAAVARPLVLNFSKLSHALLSVSDIAAELVATCDYLQRNASIFLSLHHWQNFQGSSNTKRTITENNPFTRSSQCLELCSS